MVNKVIAPRAWYVLRTKNALLAEQYIRNSIKTNEILKNTVDDVFVPLVEKVKIFKGKKITKTVELFPSFLFIHMEITKDNYNLIKYCPYVYRFMRYKSSSKEIKEGKYKFKMVTDEEIQRLREKITKKIEEIPTFQVGDIVEVLEGPFEKFRGNVVSVNSNKIDVVIKIFGRDVNSSFDAKVLRKI